MSEQDLLEFQKLAERLRLEYTASPEKALASLVEAGILNEHGELTEHYR